ncbi:MAG: hypothetical protein ACTSPI_16860 [Candidatus Heimdallarchaeaceae archaeon]
MEDKMKPLGRIPGEGERRKKSMEAQRLKERKELLRLQAFYLEIKELVEKMEESYVKNR